MIYKYKTEGRGPKNFRNYWNPIELFGNLRNGNISLREVLKSQNNFKSNLGEIRKGNPASKSENQTSVKSVKNIFDLRGKKNKSF